MLVWEGRGGEWKGRENERGIVSPTKGSSHLRAFVEDKGATLLQSIRLFDTETDTTYVLLLVTTSY